MSDIGSLHAKRRVILFQEITKLLESAAWSDALLKKAEGAAGFEKGYHNVIFVGGLTSLVCDFESWQDEQMLEILSQKERPKKIREQIARALEVRIMHTLKKEASINNSAFFLIPTNILSGNESACHTCDIIWKYAGDKSTDFNYYTKRGLLLPVYLSAKAFYFADNSKDHADSKEFIKNALDNIINIASFKSRINLPKIEDIPILRLFS